MVLELSLPVVGSHSTADREHGWLFGLETNLVKALLHSRFELIGSLTISVAVEDAPGFHGWLSEHLSLDLSFQFSGIFLDFELVGST